MKKVNLFKDGTRYLYFVEYLRDDNLLPENSIGFDSEKEAMNFVKDHINEIIYFTVIKQEVIYVGSEAFKFDGVKGRRRYIGEVFTKERIEKEEKDDDLKQTVLRRLNGYNVELAVKPYNSASYEFLLSGEKVYNKNFEQVYPKVKAKEPLEQKSR